MNTVTITFKAHFYGEVPDVSYFTQTFTGTSKELRNHIKETAFHIINKGDFEDVTANVIYSDGEEVDFKNPLDIP